MVSGLETGVVENVSDVGLFSNRCAVWLKPCGMMVVSTLNRNWKSFALASVGAEYVLRWLQRGTHQWDKFVTPDELAHHLGNNKLGISEQAGVVYSPFADKWSLSSDMDVNYMVVAEGGTLEEREVAGLVRCARVASRGDKRFLITHSEIFPGSFASTTETTDYLVQALGLRRTSVLRWGPRGMQQLSEVKTGRFEIEGFAGNAGPDHIDQFHGMPEFLRTLRGM